MQTIKVWDPFVRLFHWSLVMGITLDALVLDEDSRLHEQVGYVVLGLIGARVVWGWLAQDMRGFHRSNHRCVHQLNNWLILPTNASNPMWATHHWAH